jgi:hypothetical protein
MTKLTTLLIIAVIGIATGCSSSRPSLSPFDYEIAWNEDTVNDYRLIFTKKGDFTYMIKDGVKHNSKIYKGTFGGVDNEIFLKFNSDKPEGLNPVVIIEASNNYYIQYFTDGRKRMFLRIQKRPIR